MIGLTTRQRDCLEIIKRLCSEDDEGPSFDELRLHMGLASKSGIHRHVHALMERGLVGMWPNRKRSLYIIEQTPDARDAFRRERVIRAVESLTVRHAFDRAALRPVIEQAWREA